MSQLDLYPKHSLPNSVARPDAGKRLHEASVLVTVRDIVGKEKLGGVGTYYKALQPHLGSSGYYFTVGKRRGMQGFFRAIGQLSADYLRLWGALSDGKWEVVHVNPSLCPNCLVRDAVSLALSRVKGRKTIVFFRGWDEKTERRIGGRWGVFFRRAFGKTDGAIVLSAKFAGRLRAWGYTGPIFVETTAVDETLLAAAPPTDLGEAAEERTLRILFLARIERDKGIFEAIDAFARLSESWAGKVELVVAGDGSDKAGAEEYVRNRGVAGVRFLGYVSGAEKAAAYRTADLYLFPSRHGEGMPNSVLEAMAFGLPVISTPVGGLPDFFENEKMGYLIESTEPDAWAHSIGGLLANKELRENMGRYGAAFARENFFASAVANRLEGIWSSVAACSVAAGTTVSWIRADEKEASGL